MQENILPVQVQVYYETLCPYSIDFINQQLYPTYQNLGQYLDIEFIPYGNAQVILSIRGTTSTILMIFELRIGSKTVLKTKTNLISQF